MQERYLFRAKRNGEWVKGGLCESSWGNSFIITNDPNIVPDTIKVDPDTICQCTGLKDKNGKLIWENDIVKDDVIYGVVKWDDANARYIIDDRDDGYQEYSDWWHEVEVIGNIFDNPEMLEVDHDGE